MLMLLRLLLATVFFYMNWKTGTMNRKLTGMKLVHHITEWSEEQRYSVILIVKRLQVKAATGWSVCVSIIFPICVCMASI